MKKTYIAPNAEAYLLQTRDNLLTTSTVGVSSKDFDSSKGTIMGRADDFDDED